MSTAKKLMFPRQLLIACMVIATISTGSVEADFTLGSPTNLGSTVNSSAGEEDPEISADGLKLYFNSNRADGYGKGDIWVTSRATIEDDWGAPANLGLTVNGSSDDFAPDVSPDGLILHFASDRPGGYGSYDLWVTSRATPDGDWGKPLNLGSTINSSAMDGCPAISDDGLELYFWSNRSGGSGSTDLWVATRAAIEDDWGTPVNLGPLVNSAALDFCPHISADGLSIFFVSGRSGGYGGFYGDIWLTTRPTISDPWGTPVNLGPMVNSSASEGGPALSADGSTFCFSSEQPGGFGSFDIWQVSITPIVDFNGDGIIDMKDFSKIAQYWGQDEPCADIGPTPFGNSTVDIEDLAVLSESWLVEFGFVAHWKLDETAGGIAHDSIAGEDGFGPPDLLWRPQDGKVRGALELDGIDDLLFTTFSLNPADTSFSVFAWVKGGAPSQVIISQSGGANWLLADASEGKLMTELQGTGRFDGPLLSETVITDGAWRRVGLTWDGSNRILYVDDVEVARDTQTGLEGSNGGLYFGAGKNPVPPSLWLGLLDDIRIYDQVIVP